MAVSSTTGGLRTGVCLSTDRPQNPYNGQVVYETDTNRTLVWDNSAWVVVADPALVSFSGTGATVTADAMTVAGENVTPYTGRRNLLYNGAMQVWQRATSGTTTGADNYKTMDRWRNRTGSIGQSMTVSRQSAGLTGFQYCARIQRPSGGTDTGRLNLIQSLETSDVVRFAGQTVTLSFYARKGANFSGASNNLLTYLITGTGTDQYWLNIASGGNPLINGTTWTLTSSWQRFTASVFVPSTEESMFLDFSYDPTGTAGADDYYEITGIQLELGDKATPFEHRSYGEELALCQRYYEKSYDMGKNPSPTNDPNGSINVWPHTTTAYGIHIYAPFSVRKRTTPTVTMYDTATGTAGYFMETGFGLRSGQVIFIGETGFTLRNSVVLAGTGYINAHFIASAEL